MKRLRSRGMLTLASLLLLFSLGRESAIAQAEGDLTSTLQAIANQSATSIKTACPLSDNTYWIGISSKAGQSAQIQCQVDTMVFTDCATLAVDAGGDKQALLTGQTTYPQLMSGIMSQQNAGVSLQAAYLAGNAPSTQSPSALAKKIYTECSVSVQVLP